MRKLFLLPLAALLLASSGCNVFAPFYSEGGDVATLLEDARHARASGDLARAISLLERALEQEPSHPIVRLDLSTALLQQKRLGLLELEALTRHFLDAFGVDQTAGRTAASDSCTFEPGTQTGTFDPRGAEGYAAVAAARPTLRRVVQLLSDPAAPTEAPAMPSAFTSLDICEAVSDGAFSDSYRLNRSAVLAALRNQFPTDAQVTAALSTAAVAYTLGSYVAIFEQPDLPVAWFTLEGDRVGGCVAAGQYDLFVSRTRAEVRQVGRALFALDLLMAFSGQQDYQEYVEDGLELLVGLDTGDFSPCDA